MYENKSVYVMNKAAHILSVEISANWIKLIYHSSADF